MVETEQLSDLSKKIIQLNTAINHNCVLKLTYKRGDQANREEHYIQSNNIITFESIFYLYLTYDKREKRNQGVEKRPFAFNSINDIETVEYMKDTTFRINKIGNSFGFFEEATKQVTLKLTGRSANFFKREGLFNNPEVILLVQQWLPYILVVNNSSEAEEIIGGIERNYRIFFDGG